MQFVQFFDQQILSQYQLGSAHCPREVGNKGTDHSGEMHWDELH